MIKKCLWMAVLAMGASAAWGFALLGPIGNGGDSYQVVLLGYNLPYLESYFQGGPVWLGDIGGPKNIGEEYRRNTPTLYYAFDSNFSGPTGDGFFGAAGEDAVDRAFAIMNSLTNVDSYSDALSEFPLQSQNFNYRAQSDYLTDLKSVTLHLLVEQLGLAEPERYAWTLHDRFKGNACPLTTTYTVVQRNLDIIDSPLTNVQYTAYVNGVLYSYYIIEDCDGHPPPYSAITVPFSVDPEANIYNAVAANDYAGSWGSGFWVGGLQLGGFYNGLTRDDVAGLRYLMSTNNVNQETAMAGSLMQNTNLTTWQGLSTADLGALVAAAKTNDPGTLATLFTGLVVESSSSYPVVVTNLDIITYFTNYPGEAFGTPPTLVTATNGTNYAFGLNYVTTFENVIITTNWFANSYRTNTSAKLMTIKVGPEGAVGNPLKTNITYKTVTLTNVASGDYYLIPPGTCGFSIPNPQPSGYPIETVTITTNLISQVFGSGGSFYSQSLLFYSTNHIFAVHPCTLESGATGRYQGVKKVQFVRLPDAAVDPLTGNLLHPYWVTNFYTMVFYNPTNFQLSSQTFQRVVTRPDILITAQDLAVGPAGNNFNGTVQRNINFETANTLPGKAGPGVIDGSSVFVYNSVGGIYENGPWPNTNSFIFSITPGISAVNETTQTRVLRWASFDATTNDPVVFPNGTTIKDLEDQMVVSISPATLMDGTNNQPYSVTLTVTGGKPAYSWSLAPGSASLPIGLVLIPSVNGATCAISGTPSGNPPATYDFKIQLNDSAARTIKRDYSITLH
jgi:hypothetical protein